MRGLIPPFLLLCACAGGDRQASSDRTASAPAVRHAQARTATWEATPPHIPADPVLARMLAAIGPFQADRQPCIAKNPLRPDFSPEQNRRGKIIWSDSLELQRRIRAAYGDRILVMMPDVSAGADAWDGRNGARFLVKVTGHDPLPAYRLGGRARDVPVVVEYGMPYSADQLQEKVNAAHDDLMRLLPDAQGWSVSNGYGYGALFINVYSPSGQPPANLTGLCEQLVEAAGMPVLLNYGTGRVSVGPAPRV